MFHDLFFNVNTDCFLNHHYHIYIEKEGKQTVRAYEADLERKKLHIVSTLGEYFERDVLTNNNPIAKKNCKMVSMVTGQQKLIHLEELLFVNQFVDSCGMASHYFSTEVIWKAYKEYFERQSFISNFLFELEREEIMFPSSTRLGNIDKYLTNYLDEIHYYNISMCHGLYVILAIGTGVKNKAAGLGTSRNIEKAIEKAQKEILQYFSVAFSKYSTGDKELSLKIEKRDVYHEHFETMSVEKFKKMYSYLNNCQMVDIQCYNSNKYLKQSEIIKSNYDTLGMEPYITVFDGIKRLGIKVVKIRDFNWFPHMRPELYSKDVVCCIEKRLGRKVKKDVKWIPFA